MITQSEFLRGQKLQNNQIDALQSNVNGKATGPAGAAAGNLAAFADATGKVLADSGVSLDGWVKAPGEWAYYSATNIIVPPGTPYAKGAKIKWVQGGNTYYGYMHVPSGSTIKIFGNAVQNAPIAEAHYSLAENPVGFPDYFNWDTTLTGINTGSTHYKTFRCKMNGSILEMWSELIGGTSNSTVFSFTIPLEFLGQWLSAPRIPIFATDNGVSQTTPAHIGLGYPIAKCYKTHGAAETSWTASGGKYLHWVHVFFPV